MERLFRDQQTTVTATVKSFDPDEDMDQLPSLSSSIVGTLCWFNQYD
jgi:hypothetical protein